jgi:hypothetical protein
LRLRVLEGYGGCCVCCGETEDVFLQFDHVDGGGVAHRRRVRAGVAFWLWMIKNNFPPEIQVLCANCHAAKSKGVVCPHQRSERSVPDELPLPAQH